MSIYEGSVNKPVMTSLCFLAVAIMGLFSLQKLPIDLYPDIETNTIMIMTAYPGASAADIETNVTRPLENTLNAVSNLKHISSKSRENISLITLEFEFGNDIDVITNDVRDKLDMVKSDLPDDAENPIIFKFSTDMIPIVLLSVQANESMPALYKILDEKDKAVLCLEHMNNNMWKEDYHEYVEWKNNLHSYLKLIYSDMWYGEREK